MYPFAERRAWTFRYQLTEKELGKPRKSPQSELSFNSIYFQLKEAELNRNHWGSQLEIKSCRQQKTAYKPLGISFCSTWVSSRDHRTTRHRRQLRASQAPTVQVAVAKLWSIKHADECHYASFQEVTETSCIYNVFEASEFVSTELTHVYYKNHAIPCRSTLVCTRSLNEIKIGLLNLTLFVLLNWVTIIAHIYGLSDLKTEMTSYNAHPTLRSVGNSIQCNSQLIFSLPQGRIIFKYGDGRQTAKDAD